MPSAERFLENFTNHPFFVVATRQYWRLWRKAKVRMVEIAVTPALARDVAEATLVPAFLNHKTACAA